MAKELEACGPQKAKMKEEPMVRCETVWVQWMQGQNGSKTISQMEVDVLY